MVLTGAQRTAFFENQDQMGIPHVTMVQLQHEGIHSVADLVDFDKDSLHQLADSLRSLEEESLILIQLQLKGQQFQPQHSSLEPSPKRDWLWHVTSSGTIKLLAGISKQQTFNGTKL